MTCVPAKRVIDRSAVHRKTLVHPCAFNQSDNWIFAARHMRDSKDIMQCFVAK